MKRKKEEYHKTLIDKICDILVISLIPFVLFLCIFILCTKNVNASSSPSTLLPFYISDENYDASTFENLKQQQVNWWGYVVFDFSYDNIIAYEYVEYGIDFIRFYGFSNNDYTVTLTEPWESFTSTGTVNLNLSSCSRLTIRVVPDNYGNVCYGFDYPSNITVGFNDLPNYPFVYLNSVILTPSYNNVDGKMVFTNNANPIIEVTGHATPPEEFNTPVYPQGHSKPQIVPPTYTVNNYSWTTYTPPSVDNSTLEKLLESLTDIVKYNSNYLKDNLHNEFYNLIYNIKGLIDYIGQTLQYYGDLIIENIQNLITTFYNNMVSIGEDITNKLTYIVSPLDASAVTSAFQDTGIYNDYDAIFDMVQDAFGFYNDISEPTSFMIPIDLRSVTILHQRQIIYIDLGCLNSCKTIIRAIMWCLLTFGLLYTIIDSIPDYLQGNDE